MSDTDTQSTLKLPDAAVYCNVSRDTIRDRIRKGQLKAFRSGPYRNSHILIRKSDLDAMMRPVPTADGVNAPPDDGLPVTLAALDARIARLEALLAAEVASA